MFSIIKVSIILLFSTVFHGCLNSYICDSVDSSDEQHSKDTLAYLYDILYKASLETCKIQNTTNSTSVENDQIYAAQLIGMLAFKSDEQGIEVIYELCKKSIGHGHLTDESIITETILLRICKSRLRLAGIDENKVKAYHVLCCFKYYEIELIEYICKVLTINRRLIIDKLSENKNSSSNAIRYLVRHIDDNILKIYLKDILADLK